MRHARILVKEAKYHVMARINRREYVFKDEKYKLILLEYIEKAKKKYTFEVHNLVIMDNHFHMIIKPLGESKLANIMKSILGGFAMKFNNMNGYEGHVWYDRFKSRVIETVKYLGRVVMYLADNPVRAGMVDHPLQYRFSSITALKRKKGGDGYKQIRKLFLSILEKPDKDMENFIEGYLSEFKPFSERSTEKSAKEREDLSFPRKKKGRPGKS